MLVRDEWAVVSEASWSWRASSAAEGAALAEGVGDAVEERTERFVGEDEQTTRCSSSPSPSASDRSDDSALGTGGAEGLGKSLAREVRGLRMVEVRLLMRSL